MNIARKYPKLSASDLKSYNYRNGGNHYILKANILKGKINRHWVAFSKSVIERLKQKYEEDFYIVIFWNVPGDEVEYYKIPFKSVKHLFAEGHMTQDGDGAKRRWIFIVKDHLLRVHANTNFSVNIREFLNATITSLEEVSIVSAEEGQRLMTLHKMIERDTEFISIIKKEYRKSCPEMRCEVCSFSFSERYGELGEGYIEAHHKLPLSELKATTASSMQDIAFVCANCHRMLHSRMPALTVDELKNVILK